MSDETTPVEVPEAPTLPETPATVAELLPFLPLPKVRRRTISSRKYLMYVLRFVYAHSRRQRNLLK